MTRTRIASLAAVVAAALAAGSALGSTAAAPSGAVVKLGHSGLGKMLVSSNGFTLYLFMADKHGKSACYGKCAVYWPPLLTAAAAKAGAGVKPALLGTTKRKDGKLQVTYAGHPLYLFKLDKKPGQTAGEGQNFFGGLWYAVSASGAKIVAKPSAGGTATTTTPTTTGSGYGYGGGY
jgi:predicted lipoprotein with Yx(FWY)xxD motif